ncbi:mitochondrial dynamics protein MID49 [Spea bombifrons]|uniref:mitochondrial dynamics protein MID49 n=1 Tax=Spea bombifrons TaxID=233779 RepID=UPI0023497D60|nr:mitochondrial dynamics protein MID49 [Spea bombifrons]
MADLQLQKKGKKNDNGVGSVVDFLLANARLVLGVGGAAMLGIATLAVKRLIDRAASPPDDKELDEKAEQKSLEETWKEAVLVKTSPKFSRKTKRIDLGVPVSQEETGEPVPEPLSAEQDKPADELKKAPICFTLQERLLDYSRHCAGASERREQAGCRLVLDIMAELQDFLRAKHPEMPFSAMQLGGPLGSCLPIGCSEHTGLTLPLVLEPELWRFIPGHETILNEPQFWMVKREDMEFTARGSSPWDRFMVGGYLSSRTVVESLHKTLVGSINWPAIGTMLECVIQPVIAPDDLKLEVTHSDFHMIIHILPMVAAKDTVLLAHHHPNAPAENLWHQSFYDEEARLLQELDGADSGVRLPCLQILHGICRQNPSLRQLPAACLRNVILHLSNETSDWTQPDLADRFLQVLEELIGYLDKGFLPGYFNGNVNLFSCLREEDIDELGYGLYQVFTDPDSSLKK